MHPHKIVEFLGMNFHLDTIYMSLLTSGIVLLIAIIATRNLKIVPTSRWQNMIEIVVEGLLEQVDNNIGPKGRKVAPLVITLFIFLLIANWVGLIPGLTSPTSDINCNLALAVMIVLVVNVLGVMNKGFVGHFSHFFKPHFLFFPINVIEEIAKPVTLSARLFGNILAGEILIVILTQLVPYLVPSIWLAFSVFVGIIQAGIFTMMSMTYLANALQDNH
jgi:F-type H+-transporting ATPase subunit a